MTMTQTLSLPLERIRTPLAQDLDTPSVEQLEDIETSAWADFYDRATHRIRGAAGARLVRVGGALVAAAARFDVLAYNRVIGRDAGVGVDDTTLRRVADCYRELGVRRVFLPRPPGLDAATDEALRVRGFRPHNRWVKLWRSAAPPPVVQSTLVARRLGRREMPIAAAVLAAGFAQPPELGALLASPLGCRGWQHFAVDLGGRIVAVAGLFVHGTTCWFGPAATLPERRGLGAQKVLVAARIEAAREAGCRLLVSETAEPTAERPAPSFHNLRRLGFAEAYRRPNHVLELD
jgi:GNAT superfamily N-acetyltransferase